MPAGLLSSILDTTGKRVQERIAHSDELDNEKRKVQAETILKAIQAVDENGNLRMDAQQVDEALDQYNDLYKHNKNAKDIILKAKEVFGHIFGGGKSNPAMVGRAAQQTSDAVNGGQGGQLVAPPAAAPMSEATPVGGSSAAPPTPYTPPPPSRNLPVQEVATAATTALPAPPPRTSFGSLLQTAAPNPVKTEIAKESRGAAEWDRQAKAKSDEWEHQQVVEHTNRMAEIAAQKVSPTDVEVDTFTNADGYRVTTFRKADNSTYDVVGTQKVKETEPAGKSGQADEVVFLDGTHGPAVFNPDLSNPARYTDLQGNDISAKVKGKYFPPSASVQLLNAGMDSVDSWVAKAGRGEIRSLAEIPGYMRNEVIKRMEEKNVRFEPAPIRDRRVSIQQAKNLLDPIKKLVKQINDAPTIAEKLELSYALETQAASTGTLLSRSLGERGVATEGDVQRALGLVPGWKAANFAPDFAQEQIARLEGVINAQDTALETYFKEGSTNGPTPPPTRTGAPTTIKMSGPKGTFNVPSDQKATFETNGYKEVK